MRSLLLLLFPVWIFSSTTLAQSFHADVAPLIESSCIDCHDSDTDTGLDLASLGQDLADPKTFRKWERVFDRIHDGEMPPESEQRPDPQQLETAISALRKDLQAASSARQTHSGRVPARRLTKLELGYTLQDLLLIDQDVTRGIPDEVESGSFDTIGSNQRISAVHMESYLDAADEALGAAIRMGRNPYRDYGDHADSNFAHLEQWHEKPLNQGGSITRKLKFGRGVALFRDVDYLTQFTYGISAPGIHRLTARIAAYQSRKPLTAKFIVKNQSGGARLAKSIDLQPGEPQTVVVETFLQPGDVPYLTFANGVNGGSGVFATGAREYKGPGLAIMSQKIEGPLAETWPPPSTRQLLSGLELDGSDSGPFIIRASDDSLAQVSDVVAKFASRALRRPVSDKELMPFVGLAETAIEDGRDFLEVLRVPMRSILSSPQFMLFDGEAGQLDDHALANRLSYFLWKSMPDDQLRLLADQGKLSDAKTLADQVERMLADEKSSRFIKDFVGQWLRLHKVNATTPDSGLYPEFDELLSNAIPQETTLFFAHLVEKNLSLSNLIDSDFAFVNRRLAEHYGIEGVEGQAFRKVQLPEDSPRGGVLTQAAILKTTANGTTTSPVTRGNFVLTNFLGTPPSPPPPGVGSVEPDTRGETTIREILAAHRELESCNQCHRAIDPPGFAMECFDPIGGFRSHYRASGGEQTFGGFTTKLPPRQGPPVDSSGVTVDGIEFVGIDQFKQLLLQQKVQVAENFISQLVVYSTGGEVQFADRDEIQSIVQRTRENDFPVRDIVHEIVQSKMFRIK